MGPLLRRHPAGRDSEKSERKLQNREIRLRFPPTNFSNGWNVATTAPSSHSKPTRPTKARPLLTTSSESSRNVFHRSRVLCSKLCWQKFVPSTGTTQLTGASGGSKTSSNSQNCYLYVSISSYLKNEVYIFYTMFDFYLEIDWNDVVSQSIVFSIFSDDKVSLPFVTKYQIRQFTNIILNWKAVSVVKFNFTVHSSWNPHVK